MRSVRVVLGMVVTLLFVVLFTAVSLPAQTATTATITGTVYDQSGALVPNAKLELLDTATGEKTSATTGSSGEYTFPAVRPGNYKITVTHGGFRQAVVDGVRVEVGKSALVNVSLEMGQMTETVEVTAGAGIELQTLNASVGNVFDSNMLKNMPTLDRDATSLLLLQPMAIPAFNGPVSGSGEFESNGGTIAGARVDQNTFMIDGGDATSNMEGTGGYNTGFIAKARAVVPTPVESLEEFRVQTNNAGTDYTRSGGAEVQMVTRRGSNTWHGAGYWYHQNDELNANDWFRNRRKTVNPEWRDNRYGGRVGGPIWKNRTFFFVHEEERHFFTSSPYSRLVPTAALRTGILKFTDASGTVRAYNLNPGLTLDPAANPRDNDPRIGQMIPTTGTDSVTGNTCDVGSSVTCNPIDPRNLGISPAIAAEFATLPLPNDFTGGDALTSGNFTGAVANTTNEHFAVLRLDHKISDKWDFMSSYRYSTSAIIPGNVQVDIAGIAPGCQKGVACSIASRPLQPRFFVAGLTGRLTPNLVNEFHFDWLRHWWSWIAPGARVPVIPSSLSDARLQIWNEDNLGAKGMVPINVNTQQARQRVWNGQDYTFSDNLSWIKGKHLWSFGGRFQKQDLLHVRDDKVVGGISTPLYYAARGGNFLDLGGITVPNTVSSSDSGTFKQAFISVTGMIDQATQVLVRDANLKALPAGSNIVQKDVIDAYEMSFSDTWHVKPSLTFSYGLSWGVQLPPFDPVGKTTMMIDVSSGQIITADQLLNAKRLGGLNGNVVAPTVGYVPIKSTGRKYPYDPDYTNFGPRLALAWNPSFTDGALGKFFGSRKTVIRGGWARAFERKNGVNLVLTPALGLGFGDLSACVAPLNATAAAALGQSVGFCSGFATAATAFRIGNDGNHINIPSLPTISGGVIIPGNNSLIPTAGANSFFEPKDSRLDPRIQVGSSDSIDVSIQRELPGKMLLEVGYVGRWSRDLFGNIDLNAIPYMFTPNSASFGARRTNQSFATAFDNVAKQLQQGLAVTPQAWFNAMMKPSFCASGVSASDPIGCTTAAVNFDAANGNPFWPAHGAGALWSLIEPNFVTGPMTLANSQVGSLDWARSNTSANYHAGFVTLRMRANHGLTVDLNYTFSHSLDNFGLTQDCTTTVTDAFDPHREYGPSLFDRRHTFNLLVNYELPMGKGKGFAAGPVADRVLGGWSVSGIYTATTGIPDLVWDDLAAGTEFGSTAANNCTCGAIGLLPTKSGVITETRNNNPTVSSSGFGKNSVSGVPNAFPNPDAVACATPLQGCPTVTGAFRYPTFADNTLGFGAIRGPFRWNFDFAVAKTTRITERVSTRFDVQFVNAFNHFMMGLGSDSVHSNEPGADVSFPKAFGVPSRMFNVPRYIQIGLRFDF